LNSVGELIGDYFRIRISPERKTEFISKLNIGEILEGRVVKSLGNQKAVVNFKGIEVLAETRGLLSSGEHIVVKVAQLKPGITLNLLHQNICTTDKTGSLLKMYLPCQAPLGHIIGNLQKIIGEEWLEQNTVLDKTFYQNLSAVLSSIVFDEGKTSNPEFLLNFITQSGLLYESKLKRLVLKNLSPQSVSDEVNKDLKGLLMKISEDPNLNKHLTNMIGVHDGLSNEKAGYFLKTVSELINNIELNQLTNYLTKQEENYLYLQIPLAFQDGIDNAELYLYYDRRRVPTDAEKEDFNLVFLLNMEGLGNIRIDTNVKKRDIYCRIAVESHEVARFINEYLPRLRDNLSTLGYTVEEIDCFVLEDPSQAKVNFGENFISDSINILDVMV